MASSPIFDLQAPKGVPLSSEVEIIADPLLPPQSTKEMLAHFWAGIYDLRDESHLSRLLGVLLGDTGAGQLRKKVTYAHLSQMLNTAHFYDLDRLFADVFGLKRFLSEGLPFDPYGEGGTSEEWEAVLAADSAYRNRVGQFVRGVNMGATPSGINLMASAVLGTPVHVYEIYRFLDNEQSYAGGTGGGLTYEGLEKFTYGDLDGRTYGSMEGTTAYAGRGTRTEFVIRPKREVSHEERYHLSKVINRLKPVGSMMTLDQQGVETSVAIPATFAYSTESYWHIRQTVVADVAVASAYPRYEEGVPTEQPRAAFSDYQGEEWFYNGDVLDIASYAQEDGVIIQSDNYERVINPDTRDAIDYRAAYAVLPQIDVLRGRSVRDGVMVTPTVDRMALS